MPHFDLSDPRVRALQLLIWRLTSCCPLDFGRGEPRSSRPAYSPPSYDYSPQRPIPADLPLPPAGAGADYFSYHRA